MLNQAESIGVSRPQTAPTSERRPNDAIGDAVRIMRIANADVTATLTGEGMDKAAQVLERKGGAARAKHITLQRSAEIAKNAATAGHLKKPHSASIQHALNR